MDFLPFPKISTSQSSAEVRLTGTWIAQEKIHGAHFVIGIKGNSIRFGKRKSWLRDDDPFFGWQLIRSELTEQAFSLRDHLESDRSQSLYLYGELFGGHYPHPDVEPVQGMTAVQTGVWYSPEIKWSVFDAVVCPELATAECFFVDQKLLMESLVSCQALTPVVRGRGVLNDLWQLNVRFPAQMPSCFGLPEIKNNWAEGLVIKPQSQTQVSRRVVYKRKIDEFNEKQFDESECWDERQIVSPGGLMSWATKMVNPARIASARSKIGDGNNSALVEEIVLDVLIDLNEALPLSNEALSDLEQQALSDHIIRLAEILLAHNVL